jgi:hypothetical protein
MESIDWSIPGSDVVLDASQFNLGVYQWPVWVPILTHRLNSPASPALWQRED